MASRVAASSADCESSDMANCRHQFLALQHFPGGCVLESSTVRCDLAWGQDQHTRAEIAAWSAGAALARAPDSADRTSDLVRHHRRFFRDPSQCARVEAAVLGEPGHEPGRGQSQGDRVGEALHSGAAQPDTGTGTGRSDGMLDIVAEGEDDAPIGRQVRRFLAPLWAMWGSYEKAAPRSPPHAGSRLSRELGTRGQKVRRPPARWHAARWISGENDVTSIETQEQINGQISLRDVSARRRSGR